MSSSKKIKHPTMHEKIKVYEELLHSLQFHSTVSMRHDQVLAILEKINAWSYAHRQGNGELSEAEQQARIDEAFWQLDRVKL